MSTFSGTIDEIIERLEKIIEEAGPGYGFDASFRICPYHHHMGRKRMQTCEPCKRSFCSKLRAVGLTDDGKALPTQERPRCSAKTRAGSACKHPVSPAKRRCRLHGGTSTGPKTEYGKKRIAEGQRKRREREKTSRSGHKVS